MSEEGVVWWLAASIAGGLPVVYFLLGMLASCGLRPKSGAVREAVRDIVRDVERDVERDVARDVTRARAARTAGTSGMSRAAYFNRV